MNMTRHVLVAGLASLSLSLFGTAAGAADAHGKDTAAKAQYDAERTRCMSGTTGQDQASCLRSAGAAYDSIRQGRMNDANTTYRENAMSRCRNLPPADKADCESRVDGEGTSSGSVKGGGIVTETLHHNINPSGTATTNRPVPTPQ